MLQGLCPEPARCRGWGARGWGLWGPGEGCPPRAGCPSCSVELLDAAEEQPVAGPSHMCFESVLKS